MILSMKTKEKTPKTEIEILREKLAEVELRNVQLQQEYLHIKEQLNWLLRQIFGKKSEQIISDLEAVQLEFEGFEVEKSTPSPSPPQDPKPPRKPRRDGQDAIKIPPNLPVQTVVIDIPEKDKVCKETGAPLKLIGEEITLKLAHAPGSFFLKKIIRLKYANPSKEEQGILCAELPSTIFPKCRADDSLLADVVVRKFGDHNPLYRISEIFQRDGIGISRKLLSQWVRHCGVALTPLYDEMLKQVISSGNIFVDESPINIQDIGRVKKGYMWTIVGGAEPNPSYKIYSFAGDRCHDYIFKILDGYKGVLHSDKYQAYETLSKN